MKTLKITNIIAIGIPLLLFFFGFIYEIAFYLAAYSTILTGFMQIIIGLIYWSKFKKDKNIKIYFLSVIGFFFIWYCNENIKYIDELTYPLIATPLILAIYLSLIIHLKEIK